MCRYNKQLCKIHFVIRKKLPLRFYMAVVIAAVLWIGLGLTVLADEQTLICPEGQFVALFSRDEGAAVDFYNAYGEKTCSIHEYYGPHAPLYLCTNKLKEVYHGFSSLFYNLETGKKIAEFSRKDYSVQICGDYLVSTFIKTQETGIYDSDGKHVMTLTTSENAAWWEIEGRLYCLCDDKGSVNLQRFDNETGRWESIYGDCFFNHSAEEFKNIFRFGDYYLFTGKQKIKVVDHDWKIILESTGFPVLDSNSDLYHGIRKYMDTFYFLVTYDPEEENPEYHVLDRDLEERFAMSKEDWDNRQRDHGWGRLCNYREAILFASYPELNGLECSGILSQKRNAVPYANDGDLYYFAVDGQQLQMKLPAGQYPVGINENFLVTSDGEDREELYDIHTGEKIELPEHPAVLYYLLEDTGLIARCEEQQEGKDTSFYIFYDGQLNEVMKLPCEERSLCRGYNGTWYYRTELMDGIIDENGRWLVRRWNAKE